MDQNLILAALVLFIMMMEVHHITCVEVLDPTENLTLGGNNAAFGIHMKINATQSLQVSDVQLRGQIRQVHSEK